MNDLARLLADPACVWSVGTGAAMMAFVPSGTAGRRVARHGDTAIEIADNPRILAFETISADPRGWNHALALCVEGGVASYGDGRITAVGPDCRAIDEADRASPVFDLGGDAIARFLLRPDAGCLEMLGPCVGQTFDQVAGKLAHVRGCWIVETPVARIEHWQAGGLPPVHRLGAGPARTTPLPPGWVAGAHVFPPHPARSRPGQPARFDPQRHADFQTILAQHGRPDLVRLKDQVNTLLAAGQFRRIMVDRHGAAVIRVALRQALARDASAPPEDWLRQYDRPLWAALHDG